MICRRRRNPKWSASRMLPLLLHDPPRLEHLRDPDLDASQERLSKPLAWCKKGGLGGREGRRDALIHSLTREIRPFHPAPIPLGTIPLGTHPAWLSASPLEGPTPSRSHPRGRTPQERWHLLGKRASTMSWDKVEKAKGGFRKQVEDGNNTVGDVDWGGGHEVGGG